MLFFFSSRRRHTRCSRDWSSDVCSSDLLPLSNSHRYTPADPCRKLMQRWLGRSRGCRLWGGLEKNRPRGGAPPFCGAPPTRAPRGPRQTPPPPTFTRDPPRGPRGGAEKG